MRWSRNWPGGPQKAVEKAAYEQRLAEERAAEEARKELIKTYEQKAIELNDAINGTKNNFNLLSTMYDTSTDLNTGLLGPDFLPSMCKDYALLKSLLKKSGKEI